MTTNSAAYKALQNELLVNGTDAIRAEKALNKFLEKSLPESEFLYWEMKGLKLAESKRAV